MKRLTLLSALLLVSSVGYAAEMVEHKTGRVVNSGKCKNGWVFTYFDGARLRHPCIGSTDTVSLKKFVQTAIASRCRRQVRVNGGIIEDSTLFADEIEEGENCHRGGR